MEEVSVQTTMLIVAVATLAIGGLILALGAFSAAQTGEPMAPRMRRNALILMVAGPANLLLWWLFNGVLAEVGYRSAIGYVLAAVVFVAAGFATGFFSRLRERRAARRDSSGPEA